VRTGRRLRGPARAPPDTREPLRSRPLRRLAPPSSLRPRNRRVELVPQLGRGSGRRSGPRHHDDVSAVRECAPPQAKPLANRALYTRALHCVPDALAHDEPEPRSQLARHNLERNALSAVSAANSADPRVVPAAADPISSPKTLRTRRTTRGFVDHSELRTRGRALLRADRRDQTLAPFGAAATKNRSATLRAHSLTKAVRALSSDTTRLESALHTRFLLRPRGSRKESAAGYPPAEVGVNAALRISRLRRTLQTSMVKSRTG